MQPKTELAIARLSKLLVRKPDALFRFFERHFLDRADAAVALVGQTSGI